MTVPPLRTGMVPAFHELGDDLFEDLCREVTQEEDDVATVERYGTSGQRQLGIDLLIEYKDDSLAAGQCKSETLTWVYLPASTKGKLLRLEGRLVLTAGDIPTAKSLAIEADSVDRSEDSGRARLIAMRCFATTFKAKSRSTLRTSLVRIVAGSNRS